MPALITRRAILAGTMSAWAIERAAAGDAAAARLADLEAANGGRLGVAVMDMATGTRIEHRAHERFAMCSTFKFLAAACVLARVDRNEEAPRAAHRVCRERSRHLFAGDERPCRRRRHERCRPVRGSHDGQRQHGRQLVAGELRGPPGLTAFVRSIGDDITRLDRIETSLNEATPGDPRDTTTPAAMLEAMRKLLLGEALSAASRAQLTTWLVANKTGDKRLRAGLPKDWRVGDKTGSGGNGATNDIAIAWPAGRAPIFVSAYFAEAPGSSDAHNAVLEAVGRIAASEL
jgi:beta-lactamase class A